VRVTSNGLPAIGDEIAGPTEKKPGVVPPFGTVAVVVVTVDVVVAGADVAVT
jgi:hypothetical protein